MLCHWSNGWSAENVTVCGMWQEQPVRSLTYQPALDGQEPIDIDGLTGRCRLDPAANCYQAGPDPGPTRRCRHGGNAGPKPRLTTTCLAHVCGEACQGPAALRIDALVAEARNSPSGASSRRPSQV